MAPARVQSVARRKKLNKSLSSMLEKRAPGGPALHSKRNFASGVSLKCSRAFLAYETDEPVLIPCQTL